MPQIINVPGHGQVSFPDGMTDDQIVAAIKANTPEQPGIGQQLARQVGLTARAGAQGVLGIPAAIGDALGFPSSQAVNNVLDLVGLPSPQNATERFANAVASGMAIPGSVARALPQLGERIGTQILSSGAASGSSDLAHEAGLGPLAQMSAGVVGGLALPTTLAAATTALKAGGRAAGSLVAPLTQQGRMNIAAKAMQGNASSPATAAENIGAAPQYVPGVAPTTAGVAGDSGIASLYKALRNQATAPFTDREAANDAARQTYAQQVFGTRGDIKAALASRDATTTPMRENAFAQAGSVDTSPIVNAGNAALDAGAKYRGVGPALQKFVSDIAEINDPQVLYNGPRKAINDALSGRFSKDSPLASFSQAELIGLRNQIDNTIESVAPGFKQYLATHANLSKAIDAKQLGQDIVSGSVNPQSERLSAASFARQMANNEDVAGAGPQVSDALTRLNMDLKRSVGPSLAMKTSGSDTLQNMVGNDMVQRAIGRVPGGITTKALSKVASFIYSPAEQQTRDLLMRGMLDPQFGQMLLTRQIAQRPDLIKGLLGLRQPIAMGGLLGTVGAQ